MTKQSRRVNKQKNGRAICSNKGCDNKLPDKPCCGACIRAEKAASAYRPSSKDKARTRQFLAERDGLRCFYCEVEFELADLTIEHLLCTAHGGSNLRENFCLACKSCNHLAADMSVVKKVELKMFLSEYKLLSKVS